LLGRVYNDLFRRLVTRKWWFSIREARPKQTSQKKRQPRSYRAIIGGSINVGQSSRNQSLKPTNIPEKKLVKLLIKM